VVALVTGSAGLIGAESVRFFADKGLDVVGIDNDMRAYFFGPEASTDWSRNRLQHEIAGYQHTSVISKPWRKSFSTMAQPSTSCCMLLRNLHMTGPPGNP